MFVMINALYVIPGRLFSWLHTMRISVILASCSLFCASILPWLKDPLGEIYCAWQLPIYIGWLHPINFLNYGLLCLCCALYIFLFARPGQPFLRRYKGCAHCHKMVRFVPLVPVMLFFFQYLCADMATMALLADHERQMLFIQWHFGYQGIIQLISLHPFTLNVSTLWGRMLLLLDCISYAPLFLCAIPLFLPAWHTLETTLPTSVHAIHKHKFVTPSCFIILFVLFVRAPSAALCEYTGKEALATGNYTLAQNLFNVASFFNPEFEQMAFYHVEQGQAQYFSSLSQLTADSRVYLATSYRAQGDYLDAYQQLLVLWHTHPDAQWIVDEVDRTLESMIEARRPLRGQSTNRINVDDTALPWLQVLTKIHPSNIYVTYMIGRIHYDLHNYSLCISYMSRLLQPNLSSTIRSSAYTYIALSENGQGNYTDARLHLFEAISLDPDYHNNTAREELSGLH